MTASGREEKLRRFLLAAIWTLLGVTLAGAILGAILFSRIRTPAPAAQQTQIAAPDALDKYTTGVLVAVQNAPLTSENAPAALLYAVSFDALNQRLSVTALDPAAPHGQDTLGALYAQGGPAALINALNENPALRLQYYACTDARSLAAMIDLLGGVRATLTREEAAYLSDALGTSFAPGETTLDGTACMVHAMDARSGAPDESLRRGLALVGAAVSDMRLTATKEAMIPLLALVFGNIRTNLDFMTLRNIGYEILKADALEYALGTAVTEKE